MADEFSARYGDLLTGSCDCVDRIVLNAYFSLGYNPGGFRVWWRRWHDDGDATLDNAHLMRLAGRFARRVRAFGRAHDIPVLDCSREDRKHRIAEDYLREHPVGPGVFGDPGGPGAGDGVGGQPDAGRGDPEPGEEAGVRQPLLVSHHGPDLGASDDQDVRASAVRCADHPQRP
jgi:hypothetical protein